MTAPDAGAPHNCDGGWKTLGADSLDRMLEGLTMSPERRAAIGRDTVYPCRVCRPQLFFRWIEGHLEPDHERRTCEECSGAAPRRPRPTPRPLPEERERADLA